MRTYLNIDHFRAPYKNIALAGYGACGDMNSCMSGCAGFGAVPGSDLPAENPYASMFVQKDGMNYWSPEAKKFAMDGMKLSHFQPLDEAGDRVAVIGLTIAEQAALAANPGAPIAFRASDWIAAKVKEGKAVIAPVWLLAPVEGSSREMAAVPMSDKERLRLAASTPVAGILDSPEIASGSNLLKIGLIAGGVVAGIAVLGVVAKKTFKSNRRRRYR